MRQQQSVLVLLVVVLGMVVVVPAASAGIKAERTSFTITSFTGEGAQTLEHPRRFQVDSADSYVVFSGLRWRNWGGRRAVARGKATTCAEISGCVSRRTKLVANQRRGCFGEYWNYFHMTASVVPLYGDGPLVLPLERFPCEKGE